MSTAIFLRLLRDEDKGRVLAEAIAALREGRRLESMTYPVPPVSFRQVPGSPFAYWVSERLRRLFTELPPFESEGRAVKQGSQLPMTSALCGPGGKFHQSASWMEQTGQTGARTSQHSRYGAVNALLKISTGYHLPRVALISPYYAELR